MTKIFSHDDLTEVTFALNALRLLLGLRQDLKSRKSRKNQKKKKEQKTAAGS